MVGEEEEEEGGDSWGGFHSKPDLLFRYSFFYLLTSVNRDPTIEMAQRRDFYCLLLREQVPADCSPYLASKALFPWHSSPFEY